MLVLSRKKNESIIVRTQTGERIEIRVCKCSEHKVQLGINADKSVRILREELDQSSD